MRFFLLKANEMIRVHTITSTHYITLGGTSHLRSVHCVYHHRLTQFLGSVTKVQYVSTNITSQLNHVPFWYRIKQLPYSTQLLMRTLDSSMGYR